MTTIALTPVSGSSLIAADGWDADNSTLCVEFNGGKRYEYRGLSPDVRAAYEAAESKGKYLKWKIEPAIKGVEV